MDRVTDPADPTRCKGASNDGQCRNVAEEGSDYCRAHGGRVEDSRRLYLLQKAKYRQRLAQLKDHEEIKSLREEIALCRMMIEERLNMVKTDTELLAAYSTVNSLLLTMERLIKTSHQIEQNLGALLAKPTVILLGQSIVQILIEELKGIPQYEERVDSITDRLFLTIEQATNEESK